MAHRLVITTKHTHEPGEICEYRRFSQFDKELTNVSFVVIREATKDEYMDDTEKQWPEEFKKFRNFLHFCEHFYLIELE